MKSAVLGLVLIASGFLTAYTALQDTSGNRFAAGLPESYIRKTAIEKVMPSYPEEAFRKGISGVVRLKIEIGTDGKVLRIKVKPKTDPQLGKAAAMAARQWRLEPVPDREGLGRSSLGRLTFSFMIRDGVGVVDLYDPGPNAPDSERWGYYNSPKEFSEWELWKEVTDN